MDIYLRVVFDRQHIHVVIVVRLQAAFFIIFIRNGLIVINKWKFLSIFIRDGAIAVIFGLVNNGRIPVPLLFKGIYGGFRCGNLVVWHVLHMFIVSHVKEGDRHIHLYGIHSVNIQCISCSSFLLIQSQHVSEADFGRASRLEVLHQIFLRSFPIILK